MLRVSSRQPSAFRSTPSGFRLRLPLQQRTYHAHITCIYCREREFIIPRRTCRHISAPPRATAIFPAISPLPGTRDYLMIAAMMPRACSRRAIRGRTGRARDAPPDADDAAARPRSLPIIPTVAAYAKRDGDVERLSIATEAPVTDGTCLRRRRATHIIYSPP